MQWLSAENFVAVGAALLGGDQRRAPSVTANSPWPPATGAYAGNRWTVLAAGFLAYLDEGTSQDVIREQGHLPCGRGAGPCG
ncbi:hypothetical protein ABZT06_32950 [Streptomyces sp. NPDC005483]|uniref:hypothetical protein n=1 Tax=Streptomyces sp. NPDC005483 TaxID=3154882 RepID=UPI0033BB615F